MSLITLYSHIICDFNHLCVLLIPLCLILQCCECYIGSTTQQYVDFFKTDNPKILTLAFGGKNNTVWYSFVGYHLIGK